MVIKYKHKCKKCNVNYMLVSGRDKYPICYECQKDELKGEIKDEELKKLLDIPHEYYKEDSFLRSIKINCIRYQNLTERQIEAFKKKVQQMTDEKAKEKAKEKGDKYGRNSKKTTKNKIRL